MYKKILKSCLAGIVASILVVSPISAHVTVRPAEVNTATYVTFTVSVPNEKDIPTTEIKLLLPDNISSVTPTVKSGWRITAETSDESEEAGHAGAKVTSITWSGGSIPQGQRDEFTFSAKTPDGTGELVWKAYQTYADGTVVAWDRPEEDQPKSADGSPDFSTAGPFSVTRVLDARSADSNNTEQADVGSFDRFTLYISIAALAVSFVSLALATRPKQ